MLLGVGVTEWQLSQEGLVAVPSVTEELQLRHPTSFLYLHTSEYSSSRLRHQVK